MKKTTRHAFPFPPRVPMALSMLSLLGCSAVDDSTKGASFDTSDLNLPGLELTSQTHSPEDFIDPDYPTICYQGDLTNYEEIDGDRFVYDDIEVHPDDIWCETDDEEPIVYGGIKKANSKRKWGSTVYYYIDSRVGNSFTTGEKNAIRAAFSELDEVIPGLTFVEENKSGADRIRVRPHSSKSSSFVGRQGGKQTLNINRNASVFSVDGTGKVTASYTVQHEIMHALGVMHTHQRKDRGDFVDYFKENVKDGKKRNFKITNNQKLIHEFSFDSVMMYSSISFSSSDEPFSTNDRPTLLKLDGTKFGKQRHYLSETDKQLLRAMYPAVHVPTSLVYAAGQPFKVCELEGRPDDPDADWFTVAGSSFQSTNEIVIAEEEGIIVQETGCGVKSWFWENNSKYPDGSRLNNRKGDGIEYDAVVATTTLVPVSAVVATL